MSEEPAALEVEEEEERGETAGERKHLCSGRSGRIAEGVQQA